MTWKVTGQRTATSAAPVTGRYQALVHYFSDHGRGDTVATMRVYVYGNLVAEYNALLTDGQWWQVGVVEWPASGAATWTEQDMIGN